MAIFQDSAVSILTADGNISGTVFVHIRRTKAFRRKYPSKKPTVPQQRAINAFTYVDRRWVAMSRERRDSWNDWQSWRKNFGYNRFQKINIPRRLAGLTLIMDPPIIGPA